MKALLLITLFYALPGIINYLIIRRNYKSGGMWEGSEPDKIDVVIVLLPIGNIIGLLALIIVLCEEYRPIKKLDKRLKGVLTKITPNINPKKFFQIK
jgi:hypothetical protein